MNNFRISSAALAVTGAVVILIVALTVVGWLAMSETGDGDAAHNDAETLSTAYGIARHASSMVADGSRTTALTMSQESLDQIAASTAQSQATLQKELANLEALGHAERAASIRNRFDVLAANLAEIEQERPEILRQLRESQANHRRLNYEINKPLEAALVTSLDEQLDRMIKGEGDPGDPSQWASNTLGAGDALRYHHLFNLVEAERTAVNKLKGGSLTVNPHIVAMIREDYDSAAQRMETSIAWLGRHGPATMEPQVIPLAAEVLQLGGGEQNLWDQLHARLAKSSQEQALIAANERVLDELHGELDALVADVSARVDTAATAPTRTVTTERIVLLVVAAVGIVGTLVAVGYSGSKAADRREQLA